MVSLPRDTVNVPIAPGVTYPERINALFWEYERETGMAEKALRKVKRDLSYAFGTEIDYYALVEFDGLVRLINSIGGVKVTLKESLEDPTMHIGKKGLRLKAGTRQLDGRTALAFARTRHSDTDYDRNFTEQWTTQAMRYAQRVPEIGIPGRLQGAVDLYDASDDWIPIYDRSQVPGYYMAIGSSAWTAGLRR